ncbi:hypothetical protein F5888DRAFT_1906566 [Russula emetica]|nr:hypothetical protein F5888DRAFT_1906566 [Russula emetica]
MAAATDPVADKSGFLCTYMSTHPDTLVAYVKHFGKIDGNVSSAKMLSIDSKGMDLEYKMKGALKSSKPQVVRVKFDPPLLGYEEVKPRLLGMKVDADEALGTVKTPRITHFELPFQIWITASLLLLLIYTTGVPAPPDVDSNPKFWWLARTICPGIFPNWMIPLSWTFVTIVHGGEGVYAATLAYKHHMPWRITTAWVGATTIFGFPVLMRLRHLIKQARIESIMKGH